MATLTGKQLKDSYQGLLTIKTADDANPLSGRLENGLGNAITNLGIGIDSGLVYPLTIKEDTNNSYIHFVNSTTGSLFSDGTQIGVPSGQSDFLINNRESANIRLFTSGDEKMRIDSSGNVTVKDGGFLIIDTGAVDTNPRLYFRHNSINATNFIEVDRGTNAMEFWNNGSEAMRIDSSGNVGIGTTTSSGLLTVGDGLTGTKTIAINGSSSSTSVMNLDFRGGGTGNPSGRISYSSSTEAMTFHTGDFASISERMRIDSSGNVGIGVTPSVKLDVNISTNARGLFTDNIGEVGSGNFCLQVANTSQSALKPLGFRAEDIRFATGASERMRIDSSGNVIVGNTSYNNDNVGVGLGASGFLYATRDGSLVSSFNRLTSDGDIVDFRKDGSVVGSIGTEGGDMAIGNGDAGLQFIDGTQSVRPFNMTTNARIDAQVDLGMSSTRFKDLYLSGNVILSSGSGIDFSATADGSGTMTSELLDDYEEGTWTATLEGSTTAGTYTFSTNQSLYTKIGRQVTVISRLVVDTASGGVGSAKFGGLPFTKVDNSSSTGSVIVQGIDVDNSTISMASSAWTLSASTDFNFISITDNGSTVNVDITGISTGDIIQFSFTYFV